MRRNQRLGMKPLHAGLLTIFLALLVAYFGFIAAICIAIWCANSWNSGRRATKSVSQFTSTTTPIRPE